MAYRNAVKTAEGNDLLARVVAGETTITFTKIAISDTPIESFVAKKELAVTGEKFTKDDKVGVKLFAPFSNVSVAEGYDINTIAIYAKDQSNVEIMFSYLVATDNPVWMDAYNGSVPQPVNILVEAGIWLDDGSMIIIDDSTFATQDFVKDYVQDKLESVATITIPADTGSNYTTLQDKDGVDYYYIDITVAGMTEDYVGTNALTPKMINPSDTTNFSIAEWEEIRDTYFSMIMGLWSYSGYVRVFMYDLPDIDFDVQLYGV